MASVKRWLAAALALAAFRAGLCADPDPDVLRATRERAAQLQEAAARAPRPAWLTDGAGGTAAGAAGLAFGHAAAARLGERDGRLPGSADPAPQVPPAAGPAQTIAILVSRSLGHAALRDIFAAAGAPGVRVVFRGVAPGERLPDFVGEVHGLLRGLDPVPAVELDPLPFRAAGAAAVPLMLMSGPDGEIARVAGLSDPAWLRAQVQAGRRGDLGTRGPVAAISEPDLFAEIRRRLAALDFDALRAKALASFWSRARFAHLPAAERPRERLVDPAVRLGADLSLPDGRRLAAAGDALDPLDRLPFGLRLVVFDAAEPAQVEKARELGRAPGPGRTVYLATRFDREAGWDGFRRVEDALDAPVYLLTPDLERRFALERVPATVEAAGRAFAVREYPAGGR